LFDYALVVRAISALVVGTTIISISVVFIVLCFSISAGVIASAAYLLTPGLGIRPDTFAPKSFPAGMALSQPNPPGQQFLHHALLEGAGLGLPLLQHRQLRVHLRQHGGDGGLFGEGWE